jgi:hypothetical protein
MTISGSGVVDLAGNEFRHGYSGPATTTIRNGGRLNVSSMRMAGDTEKYYTNAANSVVNVETGGTLRVSNSLYVTATERKGTLNFNGGTLEWANTNDMWHLEESYGAATRASLTCKVLEGGMNVTNNSRTTFMIGVPIQSGAEKDGGVTVWGVGSTFSLGGRCTFNGPLTVMQGDYRLGGSNLLNSNITVCVNTNANFIMNGDTYCQTIARLEGSGSVHGTSSIAILTVTEAIAPGMGADLLGTLRVVDHALDIADDVALEIDVDASGNSDCLEYSVRHSEAIDLSKMTLQVNDTTKLNRKKKYKIATLNGGIENGALFKSTNLPADWAVRYYASEHELKIVPMNGTYLIIR